MKKIKKDKFIQFRVTELEKTEIETKAKDNGFDNVSVYILWLYRNNRQ